jgi:hypothetical protein
LSNTTRTVPFGITNQDLIFKFEHGLTRVPKQKFIKGSHKKGMFYDETWGQNGKKFAKDMQHRKLRRLDRNYIQSCLNDEND